MVKFVGISVIALLCTLITYAASVQVHLSGIVMDEDGAPVPFATLYIEDTTTGTSTNASGEFVLITPKTANTLLIRAVGYKQVRHQISSSGTENLQIILEKEIYEIEQVVIQRGEDPAYAIIRKAIAQRSNHLGNTPAHTAKVYIKGVQRLLKAPEKFLGIDIEKIGNELGLDSNRTGIIYLSESESLITSSPPKLFKEEMISSKFAGNNRSFSFNRASDLQINFYENHQNIIEGLSPRPFVSPIADNALNYYRYQYLGHQEENGLSINKIRVIPRRKGEPVYQGDIYIVEDSWRIYSVNLQLTRESSINMVDTLTIRQDHIRLANEAWLPASIHFEFRGGLLGFELGGQFVAIFTDYQLRETFSKSAFRETLKIDAAVNQKDSAYWEAGRPIALSEEERLDYIKKDSLQMRRESAKYLDSLDRRTNRFKPIGFLVSGYNYRNRLGRTSLSFDSPLTSLSFNTVEGAAINYQIRYRKELDELTRKAFIIGASLRYGFVNQRFNAHLSSSFPLGSQSLVRVSAGSSVHDLNKRSGLSPLLNSVYTLFAGRNYMKLYERDFGEIQWDYALPGNVKLKISSLWENRRWLENSSTFAFISEKHQNFTPNNPFSQIVAEEDGPLFPNHRSFQTSAAVSYDFSTRYETLPTGRRYLPGPYPELTVQYTKAFNGLLGSNTNYDLLEVSLEKSGTPLGIYGVLSYQIKAGKFINKNTQLYYPDRLHFNGANYWFTDHQLSSFLLLDSYIHSTSGTALEAHAEYNLSGILTSKMPLLRKLNLQEIFGAHHLKTSEINHYLEFHAGLQWQNVRVLYGWAKGDDLQKQQLYGNRHALRIGIRF